MQFYKKKLILNIEFNIKGTDVDSTKTSLNYMRSEEKQNQKKSYELFIINLCILTIKLVFIVKPPKDKQHIKLQMNKNNQFHNFSIYIYIF